MTVTKFPTYWPFICTMTSRGMNSGDKAAGLIYTKICTDILSVMTTELDLNERDTISYICTTCGRET